MTGSERAPAAEQQDAPAKKRSTNGGNGQSKPALTDVLAPIAPLVVALGALAATGTIGRIQRNHPLGTSIALSIVIAAAAVWLMGSLSWPKWASKVLPPIAALGFAVGTGWAIWIAVESAGAESRPRVEASISPDRSKVTATVNASNMKTNQRLAFLIDALVNGEVRSNLYQAYVGADNDGNAKQTVTVTVPRAEVTDIGVKAFTNKVSRKCDDFASEAPSETAKPQGAATQASEGKAEKEKKEKADVGSGTACLIVSLVKP